MERIRAEARARKAAGVTAAVAAATEPFPSPPLHDLPAPPTVHVSDLEAPQTKAKLGAVLGRTLKAIEVSHWIPKPFRGLFRRQGEINRGMLDALRLLMKSQQRVLFQTHGITDFLEAQKHWFLAGAEARAIERSWACAIPPLINDFNRKLDAIEGRVQAGTDEAIDLRASVNKSMADLERVAAEVQQTQVTSSEVSQALSEYKDEFTRLHNETAEAITALNQHIRDTIEERLNLASKIEEERAALLRDSMDRLKTRQEAASQKLIDLSATQEKAESKLRGVQEWGEMIQQRLNDLAEQSTVRGSEVGAATRRLNALQEQLNTSVTSEIGNLKASLETIRGAAAKVDERQVADGSFLKAQLSMQQQLLKALADETTHHRLPPGTVKRNAQASTKLTAVAGHDNDAFYLAFEDRFRGSRDEIKTRMRVYIPFLKRRRRSKEDVTLLDLGCGRGEWLELLEDFPQITAQGVDSNMAMIEQCRERKFRVTQADVVAHLAGMKKESVSVVTAFHVIEHLKFAELMKLIAQSHRILKKSGVLIFETPNPRNILVGASDFYRDLTHRNPVHPDTIAFALETVGFVAPACYFLADDSRGRTAIPQQEFRFDDLNAYVNVPRDYAVIARKA